MPLVQAPVILGAPVHHELSQIGEVGAVSPATAGDLVRPADTIQPRAEVNERCVWNPDGERSKFHDDLPCSHVQREPEADDEDQLIRDGAPES